MNNYILPILILLPMVGGVLIALLGPSAPRRAAYCALAASTLTLLISVVAPLQYLAEGVNAEFQLQFQRPFIAALQSTIHLGMDGIALPLVLLTNLLSVLAIWSSLSAIQRQARSYYALMLILQGAMTGVFVSMDLLLFYVFFEFTLVPLFLLVGIWGGAQRRLAAFKLFIYTMAGGVLTFGAVVFVAWYHYRQTAQMTFDIQKLYATQIPQSVQLWLFAAFFAGFAVKVPLFPFHTWLPLAHTEAPTAGSVLLAGVLLKLGTYGFLRIALPLLPGAAFQAAPLVAVLAIVGIVYASLAAWVQSDVKKLVAYSSVAHLGFCMLGMFAFNHTGLSGSLLYMVNHGISTGALFLVVGMIYERYHTREFSRLGGLARRMPIMAFFLVLFSLSSIGLPGLNGFVSEFSVLYAVFTSARPLETFIGPLGPTYAILAATGVVLSAIYMLWMCQRVLFGPLAEPAVAEEAAAAEAAKLPADLGRREWGLLTPLAILVVLLGVYPRMYFDLTDPAIEKIQQRMTQRITHPDKILTRNLQPAADRPSAPAPSDPADLDTAAIDSRVEADSRPSPMTGIYIVFTGKESPGGE
ncbi:MAG: NADH-quinone oxidoreductase subunit M [Sedimentisphaerales bacterium]|nr:NADH-quinone oxidoreductase subunit M [Sedimentisphaerales bacterium]